MSFFRYFTNPYSRKAMIRLVNFTSAQLVILEADNPGGIHTTRITALNTAFSGLDDRMEDVQTKRSIQSGRVVAKRIFRSTTMPPELMAIYASVVLAYGEGSPDFVECFPQGRSIFTTCSESELDDHLGQLNTAIMARTVALGAPIVARAAALVSGWDTVAGAAGDAGGDVRMMNTARQAAKTALTDELFRMLLHLATTYPGNEMKFNEYVPESLLDAPAPALPLPEAPVVVSNYIGGNDVPLVINCGDNTVTAKLLRRLVGAPVFDEVASGLEPDENGVIAHTDTLPAPGHWEYTAVAENATGESAQSNFVVVLAD